MGKTFGIGSMEIPWFTQLFENREIGLPISEIKYIIYQVIHPVLMNQVKLGEFFYL